ncbi:MAG: tyrosine recombinase XerD [Cryomorphaceae bacterium]|nr:tyrosine recombinase XerD [Cryomorphaceae bacterium]
MKWSLAIEQFQNYLRLERGLSPNTLDAYSRDLKNFSIYSQGLNETCLTVDKDLIRSFIQTLSKEGKSSRTQARMRSSLRTFFIFLKEEELIDISPIEGIATPQLERKLPIYLSIQEMNSLLAAIDRSQSQGERDNAIVETLYACGLRVSELIGLRMRDIYRKDEVLRIIGKGNKERVVPIYEKALKALDIYINEVRVHINPKKGFEDHVFLNQRGGSLSRVYIFKMISSLASLAGIKKKIGPHTIRHTFATHLIQNDADIRVIQVLLGHESITTTEIYTHLEQNHLRKTLLKYHPRGL